MNEHRRKLTLAGVRNLLKAVEGHAPMTAQQIADAIGVDVKTVLNNIGSHIAECSGVGTVSPGKGSRMGQPVRWRYVGPRNCTEGIEPATATMEEHESYIRALEAEVVRLGGTVERAPHYARKIVPRRSAREAAQHGGRERQRPLPEPPSSLAAFLDPELNSEPGE